jgi:hypothetical protein
MELQGFGTSLIGRALYIYANSHNAWIPWEFVSGISYSTQILIRGMSQLNYKMEMATEWNVIMTPQSPKDWSILATILKGNGGTILLVFDNSAPKPPTTFLSFLDNLVAEGKTVLTRIWIGEEIEIPCIPDAVLFPILTDTRAHSHVFDLLYRLPGRNGHGVLASMNQAEWTTLVKATVDNSLGLMISDIGEDTWSLFWHKLEDSTIQKVETDHAKGLSLIRTGVQLLERKT